MGRSISTIILNRGGQEIQSDRILRPASRVAEGLSGGDPIVFYGKQIVFKLRVTKGKMRFLPGTQFSFEFRKVQTIPAQANIADSALFVESVRMVDVTNLHSGVLHCIDDKTTGVPDIVLSDPESGKRMNLTKGRVAETGWGQPWGPVASPDGKAVVFYQYRHEGDKTLEKIWLLETDGSKLRELPRLSELTYDFTWSPGSDAFAFPKSNSIVVVDRKTLKMTQTTVWKDQEVERAVWSPDGKWIACGGKNGSFNLVSPDGSTQKRVLCEGLGAQDFVWCPTNETLAVLVNGELSIITLDGNIVKRYCKASAVDNWSSDGRYIAYETRAGDPRQIWILRTADGESVDIDISGDCYGAAWKPHGELLVFWSETGLMSVGPDGKAPKLFGASYHGSTMPPSWLVPGQAPDSAH